MTDVKAYENITKSSKLVRMRRAENALAAIAEQGERLEAMGEPQNNVPQFCRAILRGEDVKLGDM
jgi:hypothetical protein